MWAEVTATTGGRRLLHPMEVLCVWEGSAVTVALSNGDRFDVQESYATVSQRLHAAAEARRAYRSGEAAA